MLHQFGLSVSELTGSKPGAHVVVLKDGEQLV